MRPFLSSSQGDCEEAEDGVGPKAQETVELGRVEVQRLGARSMLGGARLGSPCSLAMGRWSTGFQGVYCGSAMQYFDAGTVAVDGVGMAAEEVTGVEEGRGIGRKG